MTIRPYYKPVGKVDAQGTRALLKWLQSDEQTIRSARYSAVTFSGVIVVAPRLPFGVAGLCSTGVD